MAVRARFADEGPPLLYDVRNSALSSTSHSKLLERFLDPDPVTEVREIELVQPDGTTLLRRLPAKLRQLPFEILYDNTGLEIFDAITELEDEYYLTRCERTILKQQMRSIAEQIPDHAAVIELGCGSMTKTSIFLEALRRSNKTGISFYALDIEASFLESSLLALMKDEKEKSMSPETAIKYAGILGSYDQALKSVLKEIEGPRVLLWLGSSIGNIHSRQAATQLVKRFQKVLSKGDQFFIGLDKRKDPARIARAYNDSAGISAAFGLNGLKHLNALLGSEVFSLDQFDYYAGYNEEEGRHEAYFRSLVDQTLSMPSTHANGGAALVHLEKDELIRYEMSYKYSLDDVKEMADGSGLNLKKVWTDEEDLYYLCLYAKTKSAMDELGKSAFPTLQDFKEVWNQWDAVSGPEVITDYSEKPIHLRHPFIFYKGHLPAFCDIQISKCLGLAPTEPAYYHKIFERGIDPDVEDPSICHAHSTVPEAWPSLEDILEYQGRVRARVQGIYASIEKGEISVPLARLGRVLHMTLEHEIMHSETLTYMLIQCDKIRAPYERSAFVEIPPQLEHPKWLTIEAGEAKIGIDDDEESDLTMGMTPEKMYGWDNESPVQSSHVPAFEIQHRPVSNFEYLCFLKLQPVSTDLIPASFVRIDHTEMYGVKTLFGVIPVTECFNWPAAINYHQATAYVQHLQTVHKDQSLHIPTEPELQRFYDQYRNTISDANVGFDNWHPTDLSNDGVHVFGSLWEWTSTVLAAHSGFTPSELYPGYTTDFFDGKHHVVRGASWATHGRLVGRLRNFYQRSYCFAFTCVRIARRPYD